MGVAFKLQQPRPLPDQQSSFDSHKMSLHFSSERPEDQFYTDFSNLNKFSNEVCNGSMLWLLLISPSPPPRPSQG